MLYLTTRSSCEVYTAPQTLSRDRGKDCGLFIPIQLPKLNREELEMLLQKDFGQCVAEILNLFFSARLDGRDVDFCIGRYPNKLVSMSHKIMIAEAWHNPDWDFFRIVRNLTGRLRGSEDTVGAPSNWANIAIRIAVLFGLFSDLSRLGFLEQGIKIDVAVTAGDFSAPMAVRYAREMGLPVGTIICCCNDNCAAWDLLHHAQLRTDTVCVPTNTPRADVGVPTDLERLVFAALGQEETLRYCEACSSGNIYAVREEQLKQIRDGMFCAVIGQERMASVIRSVYRTSTYVLDPYASLAYGGLQDYRAVAGETRSAVILTEQSPVCSAETVAEAVGITVRELKARLNMR